MEPRVESAKSGYGASTVDVAYAVRGEFRNPPDAVAYPRTEGDIVTLFRWCENESLAAVPYGGGTSVVGGVNPRSTIAIAAPSRST